jgi:transposase
MFADIYFHGLQRFSIRDCLLVFDRGMVSEDNLRAIAGNHYRYVSAIST